MKYNMERLFDRDKAQAYLDKLKSAEAGTIEIRKIGRPRTLSQNRYYFALLTIYGIDIGYTTDEMHVTMKREFNMVYEKNGKMFLRSTRDLSAKEMSDYIEYIRNHAGQAGTYLPTADELKENWAYYDNLIDQHKHHIGETT